MNRSEKKEFNRTVKRLWIYLAIVFPVLIILSTIFALNDIPMWLNMMVLVIVALGLYFAFKFICDRIDNKKKAKEELEPKKKDPFAD